LETWHILGYCAAMSNGPVWRHSPRTCTFYAQDAFWIETHIFLGSHIGDAENARPENDGQRKLWVWKMQNTIINDGQKLRDLENAELENDGQTFIKL